MRSVVLAVHINFIYVRITGNTTSHYCDRKWIGNYLEKSGAVYFLRPKMPEDFEEKEGRYAFLRWPFPFAILPWDGMAAGFSGREGTTSVFTGVPVMDSEYSSQNSEQDL